MISVVPWDPDGAGAADEILVATGSLTCAGDRIVKGVAAWDGVSWSAMGSLNDAWRLRVLDGELYAVGDMGPDYPGDIAPSGIVRWNGEQWTGVVDVEDGRVSDVAMFRGELYVTGSLGSMGQGVARLRAGAWESVGVMPTISGANPTGYALTVYADELVVAGMFHSIAGVAARGVAAFDGANWRALGEGLARTIYPITVNELVTYDGQLYAGGGLSISQDSSSPINTLARWDGTEWSSVGAGVNGAVKSLAVRDGSLIAAGPFTTAGNQPVYGCARWDGTAWAAVSTTPVTGWVFKATPFRDGVFLSGNFVADSTPPAVNAAFARNLALSPTAVGTNGRIISMCVWDGDLVVSGGFSTIEGSSARTIARKRNGEWEQLPLESTAGSPRIETFSNLKVIDGSLYSKVYFASPQQNHSAIARLDGLHWRPVTPILSSTGAAVDYCVYNGAVHYSVHENVRNVYPGVVKRVDPTGVVELLPRPTGAFIRLTPFNGELVAIPTRPRGSSGDLVAVAYSPNSSRLIGTIRAPQYEAIESVHVHNDELYIAGRFEIDEAGASNVARYDGLQWHAVGDRVLNGGDLKLVDCADGIAVVGHGLWSRSRTPDQRAESVSLGSMTKIIDGTFQSFGSEASLSIDSWGYEPIPVVEHAGELVIAGDFITVGRSSPLTSCSLARWNLGETPPSIFRHPPDYVAIRRGRTLRLSASSADSTRVQWSDGNVDLNDGPREDGSIVAGSSTGHLSIAGFRYGYRFYLRSENHCGEVRSAGTRVEAFAPADFDLNRRVSWQDLAAFLAAWFASDATADEDENSLINVTDLYEYLSSYFGPPG